MPISSPIAPHASTPAELSRRLEAHRRGIPFLVYRDAAGAQVVLELAGEGRRLTVGRRDGCAIRIDWDAKVSRLHAELERIGDEWTISDDGLSHNGTHVGDERVRGQRRLRDGDLIVVGDTALAFCDPRAGGSMATETAIERPRGPALTEADRRVLEALCRPLLDSPYAAPATNGAIAAELHLSVAAVKRRLGSLFVRFGLDALPQNSKRAALAADALRAGLVGHSD
jgi:pSer/pThr/pTyr-binding forkhead associated (FHA) protein